MKSFFFAALLLLSISASAQMTPLQLNDKLTSITDSLYVRGQAWGTAFNGAYKSKQYSSLTPYTTGMLRLINTSIVYVKGMEDVNQSKPLRMAMLSFLDFEKKMITEAFIPFEAFTESTPSGTVAAQYEKLKTRSLDEPAHLAEVAAEQEKYAAANGFKIEDAKPEGQ